MDGCFNKGSPSRLPCSTIPATSVSSNGSCYNQGRAWWGWLAGPGVGTALPHLGGCEHRKTSGTGQSAFRALPPLLLALSPICGLFSSLGC